MSAFVGLLLTASSATLALLCVGYALYVGRRLATTACDLRVALADRADAEQRLHRLGEALHDDFDRAPCGLHSLDADGVFVAVNDTELQMLGYSRFDLVGKRKFRDLLSETSRQRFARELPRFKEVGRIDDAEFDLLRRDGSLVPVLLNATAVHDDDGGHVRSRSVVMLDRKRLLAEESLQDAYSELERRVQERTSELSAVITTLQDEIEERERAEELLRQSEERARAVVDSAIDGIITIDEGGIVETVNPAVERIFGWRESEIAGRNVRSLMPEPYASEHDGYLRRYRATGERNIIGSSRELVGLRRDGTTFPIEVGVSEMYLGRRRLFRGTVRDLTESKRAAERMAQLQEQLRRNEVMATIGALVAGFAHEARNPLFGISAVLDALSARFGDREEYREHLTLLRRDAKRLNDLMRDLLEFGKPSAELHDTPLRGVIEEAVGQCRALAEQRAVELETRLAPDELWVRSNERLVGAFQNLLQNAIQFSPRGATVRLETALERQGDDSWVECRVRDSGPGLRDDELERIFEPFFSRRPGGTGLGLAIVQRIVEEHRGTIAAANQPEGGAVISLRLPVAA